ncbi:MAG TPA: phosphoribosylaminoimidazolesuccinocarboxamide synthase [Tissierellaceae bacterium]|nr:phosphoribosylaminoimidazolesuccinocarboxamide synthase [Tissierellaceae bacterium]
MELIYRGKTKDVYQLGQGQVLFKFKDELTGQDGVFDPGADTVGLSVEGAGRSALRVSKFFFEKLRDEGIPTHYIDADIDKGMMTAYAAEFFGNGLEVICRYRAVGSFIRRYGMYIEKGQPLDAYVEITLKDDDRQDPLITDEALEMLDILTKEEYKLLVGLTRQISKIIRDELAKKELELYDIKLEFGRIGADKHIALIDEISAGNMRVYKSGEYIEPFRLEEILLNE